MTAHTKEPWRIKHPSENCLGKSKIYGPPHPVDGGDYAAILEGNKPEIQRAADCVNACQGIENPAAIPDAVAACQHASKSIHHSTCRARWEPTNDHCTCHVGKAQRALDALNGRRPHTEEERMNARYRIYRDINGNGQSFTVYEHGRFVGTFLDDDTDLAEYRKDGVEVEGIDNRDCADALKGRR